MRLLFVVSVHVQPGHFNWKCANLVIGSGGFETSTSKAFKEEFEKDEGMWLVEAKYEKGSNDVEGTIKKIMEMKSTDERITCAVTVVFGLYQDLASLLIEAHQQGYTGEWIVAGFIGNFVPLLVPILEKAGLKPDEVQKLLRGMFSNPR